MTTKIANKPARSHKYWKPAELQYLAENYGLICDKTLAARLQRTEIAMINIASRKHIVSRKDNFYTARTLAEVLGLSWPGTVLLWVKEGWLKGRRSAMGQGKIRLWRFSERAIVECLRQRPWLVVLKPTRQWLISDYSHHFFYIVRKEWKRDPWYTVEQAASFLGPVRPKAVYRYIYLGWLRADKMPCRHHGKWIIRYSALQDFLENDPRPQHRHKACIDGTRKGIINAGQPLRLAILWIIKCPSCGKQVRISAPPKLRQPQVRESFIRLHVNGNCEHGSYCLIPTNGTPKLAPLSRATRARRAGAALGRVSGSGMGKGISTKGVRLLKERLRLSWLLPQS